MSSSPPPPPPTIPEALFASAERECGEHVFHLAGPPTRVSSAELAERASGAAAQLRELGVERGDSVGVLGPNRPQWAVWAFATWIAGAVLVPVQIPMRVRDPAAFRERVLSLVAAGRCRRVLADPRFVPMLPDELALPWDEPAADRSAGAEPGSPPSPEDAAVIQFTSGSTAAPKGALLSHAAVSAQMDLLARGYRYADGSPRSVLGWTPFFHDLGLFANLVQPAYTGSTTHHLPTERFARDPAEWLRLLQSTRASATVGPSSAFGSALRAAGRRGERLDLSGLEAAYFAAEGVDPEVSQRMVESAREFGFHPQALGATYGLAEAVMAVSFPLAGTGLRVDRISLPELTEAGAAAPAAAGDSHARLVVSTGAPHMDLRIAGPDGPLPERQVGEIQVRGPSLMSRYVGENPPDPFLDGWLRTGDLGYLAEGELYVTGRQKDMIVSMGHNYYPEDFEWAAARVEGVRPGRCVAVTLPPGSGKTTTLLMLEAMAGVDPDALRREVERSVAAAVGIRPDEVVVLPQGTVEKTTSGKLRRAAMRDAYAAGKLPVAPGRR